MVGEKQLRRDAADWFLWLVMIEHGARPRDVARWANASKQSVLRALRIRRARTAEEDAAVRELALTRSAANIAGHYMAGEFAAARALERAQKLLTSEEIDMDRKTGPGRTQGGFEEGEYRDMSTDELKAILRDRIERQAARFGFGHELGRLGTQSRSGRPR